MPADIQEWPAELNRATSSSFTLGSLSGQVQPLFLAAPSVFAEPFDRRFWVNITSPTLGREESTLSGRLRPSWQEVEGRMAALKGMGGRVRLFDPLKIQPYYNLTHAGSRADWSGGATWSGGAEWISGLLPPSITVAEAASAGAESVVVNFGSGWASTSRIMTWGDAFECRPNGQKLDYGAYHLVSGEAGTDANGKTRLYCNPGLRVGLNVGDMIVLKYPTSVFSMIDDKQGVVTRDRAGNGDWGWSLVESLPEAA